MEKLGVNPFFLSVQIINFVILLYLLNKFLYKPVIKIFEERKRKEEETLLRFEEAKKALEKADLKTKEILEEAGEKAKRIIEERRKIAEEEAREIITSAAKKIKEEERKLKENISAQIKQEKEGLRDYIIQIAIMVTKHLLSKGSLSENQEQKLVEDSLSEIEKLYGEKTAG